MAWISVYQEVDGPKLRRLARLLETSKAEALGILNFLWFWGMNNADETGKVLEADRVDIEDALAGVTRIRPEAVVDSLFDAGWLDAVGDDILIHDWDQWQEQWYKLQRTRKNDAKRKRMAYMAEKGAGVPQSAPDEPEASGPPPAAKDESAPGKEPGKAAKKSAKPEPEKKKYAEFVSMTEKEYEKLVERFGQAFTMACIEELDNYKGAKKGRTYASDYRAILSWVVDRVKEKRPGLMKASKNSSESAAPGKAKNPFEEWGGDQ